MNDMNDDMDEVPNETKIQIIQDLHKKAGQDAIQAITRAISLIEDDKDEDGAAYLYVAMGGVLGATSAMGTIMATREAIDDPDENPEDIHERMVFAALFVVHTQDNDSKHTPDILRRTLQSFERVMGAPPKLRWMNEAFAKMFKEGQQ